MQKSAEQLWIKLKDGFTEAMVVPDGFVIRSSGETSTGHGTESMVFCPCRSFDQVDKWLKLNILKEPCDDEPTQKPTYST